MKRFMMVFSCFITFVMMIISCSDDPVTPPVTDKTNKSFPTGTGSEWTYNFYELDTLGVKEEGTEITLKTVVMGTEVQGGKEAFIFQEQDNNGQKLKNDYYYTSSSSIYLYTDLIPETNISLPLDWTDSWYQIVNSKGSKWQLKKDIIDSLVITVPAFGAVVLSGEITISVEKKSDESINFGANLDSTVLASKYVLSYVFDGTSKSYLGEFPTKFTVNHNQYYAAKIGLVKYTEEPFAIKVTIPILGERDVLKSGGNEKILITYSIVTANSI